MAIKVKNSNTKSEIYIYGDIMCDTDRDILKQLLHIEDVSTYPLDIKNLLVNCHGEPIDVHINSCGGNYMAGMAISNLLKQYSGDTTAIVDGVAASSASNVAFGCKKIIVPVNSFIMIHSPWVNMTGNAFDLRKGADMLDTLQNSMLALYKSKAREGVNDETINNMINEETWLNGEMCSKYFDIETTDQVTVMNCVSDIAGQFAKIPDSVKQILNQAQSAEPPQQSEEEIKKAIAIALALGGN